MSLPSGLLIVCCQELSSFVPTSLDVAFPPLLQVLQCYHQRQECCGVLESEIKRRGGPLTGTQIPRDGKSTYFGFFFLVDLKMRHWCSGFWTVNNSSMHRAKGELTHIGRAHSPLFRVADVAKHGSCHGTTLWSSNSAQATGRGLLYRVPIL